MTVLCALTCRAVWTCVFISLGTQLAAGLGWSPGRYTESTLLLQVVSLGEGQLPRVYMLSQDSFKNHNKMRLVLSLHICRLPTVSQHALYGTKAIKTHLISDLWLRLVLPPPVQGTVSPTCLFLKRLEMLLMWLRSAAETIANVNKCLNPVGARPYCHPTLPLPIPFDLL